jgi:peptide methionine sulfoxide reductase MsrB
MQSDRGPKVMASLAFLQSNAIADLLNNTEWGFAVAECFHIVFFAVAIGTIMIVDLRLLGLAFPRTTSAKLLRDTWVYTLIGLAVTVLAGMALFLSAPRMYSLSGWFQFKAIALLVAIVYNYTVHYKVASSSVPWRGRRGGSHLGVAVGLGGYGRALHRTSCVISMELAQNGVRRETVLGLVWRRAPHPLRF